MDFIFNEDHKIFQETMRRFVDTEIKPYADEWDQEGKSPLHLIEKFAELGLIGITAPAEKGGIGGDHITMAIMAYELGRGATSAINYIGMSGGVVLNGIAKFGTDEQIERYVKPGVAGKKIGCFGLTEPEAGSDATNIRTTARIEGDELVINGTKTFITSGPIADFVFLVTRTKTGEGKTGATCVLVDKGTPGFSVGKDIKKMGWWASETSELVFEDCRVPLSQVVGGPAGINQGWLMILTNLNIERLNLAGGSLGSAEAAFEIAAEYSRERVQFGKPICKFQSIRFKLVDMATEIELGKNLYYKCAKLLDMGVECTKEITMAKLYCCDLVNRVAYEAIHVLGGYGFTMDFPLQRIYRDARIMPIGGGTVEIQKEIIAKTLGIG